VVAGTRDHTRNTTRARLVVGAVVMLQPFPRVDSDCVVRASLPTGRMKWPEVGCVGHVFGCLVRPCDCRRGGPVVSSCATWEDGGSQNPHCPVRGSKFRVGAVPHHDPNDLRPSPRVRRTSSGFAALSRAIRITHAPGPLPPRARADVRMFVGSRSKSSVTMLCRHGTRASRFPTGPCQ